MSLKAYKNIATKKEIENVCESLDSHNKRVMQGKDSHLKANKFFYIAGLIIFLYGGLKVLDYSDRYKGKSSLPQQAIDKILKPFVPQLLIAKEPVNNKAGPEKDSEGEDEKPEQPTAVDTKKEGMNDAEKKTGEKTDVIAQKNAVKTDVTKENKEAFFDPLGITSASEVRLLEALGERRMKLEERDEAVSKRELELELFAKKLQEKWDTLQAIQEEIKLQLGQLDKAEIAKEQSLSKVYENMKPKDAARVFDLLNISVVMKVIVHMKEKKLSEIMGFVSTERARDITQELAFKSKSLSRPSPKA